MLRRLGLEGTGLAKAQCTTIRLKLLKIGALIRIALFQQVYEKLCAVPLTY
jgi:hypothetical protein